MRKIFVALVIVMLATPVMADVCVQCSQVGTTHEVEVTYTTTVGLPRAFALDVSIDVSNAAVIVPTIVSPDYYVAPGTYSYNPATGESDWGDPVIDATVNSFTIEMGSLYATNDPCHTTAPAASGTLFTFTVDNACCVTLEENAARAGVDSNGVVMEGALETVTLNGCCVSFGVEVPDVVGMTQAAAEAAIEAADLVDVNTFDWSETVPDGNVISQDPIGGTVVPLGSTVNIVVSLGPSSIVPNVVGMTEAAAVTAIDACDLVVGTKTYVWDAVVAAGIVKSQVPIGGTEVAEESAVDITVSRGPQPPSADTCGLDAGTRNAQRTLYNEYVTKFYNPKCWCATPTGTGFQCHGDADGIKSPFPNYYRVYTGDYGLVLSNWKLKVVAYPGGANPCADTDHKKSPFPNYYAVYTGDLGRVLANWKAKDANFTGGANCPLTDAANNTYVDPTP